MMDFWTHLQAIHKYECDFDWYVESLVFRGIQTNRILCQFLGFCSDAVEVSILQGWEIMSLGDWYQTFWASIVVFILEIKISIKNIMDFLTLECVTISLSWNIWHQSRNDLAPHPTRAETVNWVCRNCVLNKQNVIKNESNFLETVSHEVLFLFQRHVMCLFHWWPSQQQMLF